jgi:hypothetical protein
LVIALAGEIGFQLWRGGNETLEAPGTAKPKFVGSETWRRLPPGGG